MDSWWTQAVREFIGWFLMGRAKDSIGIVEIMPAFVFSVAMIEKEIAREQ